MKLSKGIISRYLYGMILVFFAVSFVACGDDPGLYRHETLNFEGKEIGVVESSELDLGADDPSSFGFWPASFWPAPIFAYYNQPVPVAIPISPFQAITEWVHPMYAVSMMQPFWPGVFAP
jgi:hypothetical protein